MAERCYILAGSVSAHSAQDKFPLSRSGWTAARDHVYKARDRSGAGYATLICPSTAGHIPGIPGGIPLYQCYKGHGCAIEGSEGGTVLAGSRRRRRRRRR
jgi:hypothetical protein